MTGYQNSGWWNKRSPKDLQSRQIQIAKGLFLDSCLYFKFQQIYKKDRSWIVNLVQSLFLYNSLRLYLKSGVEFVFFRKGWNWKPEVMKPIKTVHSCPLKGNIILNKVCVKEKSGCNLSFAEWNTFANLFYELKYILVN